MWLQVQVTKVEGIWNVVIEGQARTSFTHCNTEGQAHGLAHLARTNPNVAEKLHGCRD